MQSKNKQVRQPPPGQVAAWLATSDDSAVYSMLQSLPAAEREVFVARLAGQIAFQDRRLIVAAYLLPETSDIKGPVLAAEALGLTLYASREVEGYLVCTYDQLRTPAQLYRAARSCVEGKPYSLDDFVGPEALPIVMLLATPPQYGESRVADRLLRVNFTIAKLAEQSPGSTWSSAYPLPEAVELGRAAWLARLPATDVTVLDDTRPWAYSARSGSGLCYQGECLFTPWSRLSTVLSNT